MNRLLRYGLLLLFASASSALAQKNSLTLLDVGLDDYPLMRGEFFLADSTGEAIRDLLPNDVQLAENGEPREVLSLSCPAPTLPERLSSVLAIDVSGSMANNGNLDIARSAALAWIDALPLGYSECAVVSFDHLNYLHQDFTVDRDLLSKALSTLAPAGGTSYDAGLIDDPSGALKVASTGTRKRVVVFLTDGLSGGDEEEIVRLADESAVTIYTIVLRMPAPPLLKNVAERTGGAWFENVTSREEAEAIYRTILHLAQGEKPCTIIWKGNPSCETVREIDLSIPLYRVGWKGQLFIADSLLPHLRSVPSVAAFGPTEPGTIRDTVVRVVAGGGPVEIRDVEISDAHFRLLTSDKSLPVTLQPGEELTLTFRFLPDDSTFRFARINLLADGCDRETILLSGGWPGIRGSEQYLHLIRPDGGEVYGVGEPVVIEWEGAMPEDRMLLEYSTDGGTTWSEITDTASGLAYRWNAPPTPSDRCLMRIRQLTAAGESGVLTIRAGEPLYAGAFSPDGLFVALGGEDVSMYSVPDSTLAPKTTGVLRGILGLEFSPDGNTLLVSSGDIYTTLFDWRGDAARAFIGGSGDILSLSTFSPDGARIASHSYNDDVLIYDATTAGLLRRMVGHDYRGFAVDWSPDGRLIASGSNERLSNRQGIIWDAGSGTLLHELPHPDQVNSVAFSPESRRLATACHDSAVRIWDAETGEPLLVMREAARVDHAAFSPDGTLLAIALLNGDGLIRDAVTGEIVRELKGHRGEVRHIEFSPDGTRLLTVSRDSTARLWDLARLPDQSDVSDAFWSIIEPDLRFLPVRMGRVGVGTYKDSVVAGWICNNGPAPIGVDSITFAGTGYFSLVSGLPPFRLEPGECRQVEFRFAPGRVGSFQDSVIVHAGTVRFITYISGEAMAVPLRVDHPLIDFGKVTIGTFRDTVVAAVVTNISPFTFGIEQVESGGPDTEQFEILEGGEPFILNPGESRTMKLRFKPRRKGRTTGSLRLRYEGVTDFHFGLPPLHVGLVGEGICPEIIAGDELYLPGEIGADAGREVLLPVLVDRGTVPADTVGREFRILLRFNKSLLAPLDETELDLSDNHDRYVQYRGRWDGRGDTVAVLRFIAALGNAPQTPVVVEAFTLEDGCFGGFALKDGSFLLHDLCGDGGTRLFLLNDSLFLKPIRPNPVRDEAGIRFSLVEDGETELFLIDEKGERLETFVSGYLASGEYLHRLVTDGLPSGRYLVILSTPTRILSQSFVIER